MVLTACLQPVYSAPVQARLAAKAEHTPDTFSAGSHIIPIRPGFEFPHGQTLRYTGEWRFWTAGTATVRLERNGSQEHIYATADSSGFVRLLYRVADHFNSYFDARSACSYKLLKHTEEGSHRKETAIAYEYHRGKSVLEERDLKTNQNKRVENEIPGCVTDVLSGIFYVSSLPLVPGATYTFPLNDGSKTVTVEAHVEGREQLKIPAGTFQTIRVGPYGDSGILKNKGRIWIWYTDDARHLPVQMRAKLFWGTLTIFLDRIDR